MMFKYHAVLFDLDGTLLDTAPDLIGALNQTLNDFNVPTVDVAACRAYVSQGANAMLKFGFNTTEDDANFPKLRETMLNHYLNGLATHTAPFDGIKPLIAALAKADTPWGIATNKPWQYTEPLMAKFNFASPPKVIKCPEHVKKAKPHPEMLLQCCQVLGCAPEKTIYIGDHQRDIECGKRAHMATIAAAYGYLDDTDNINEWHADFIVKSAHDILPLLQD